MVIGVIVVPCTWQYYILVQFCIVYINIKPDNICNMVAVSGGSMHVHKYISYYILE